MPRIIDNLGPAFVAIGVYGDDSTWELVGKPQNAGDTSGSDVFSYGIESLDGLLPSVTISIDSAEPAVRQETSMAVDGSTVYEYAANVTIDILTNVATAQTLSRLSLGTRATDDTHPRALFRAGSGNRPLLGIGIKPLRALLAQPSLINVDAHDWWFAGVYPTQGTEVALSGSTGVGAQEDFTFTLRAARVCTNNSGAAIDEGAQIGAQQGSDQAAINYGSFDGWADLIPSWAY